jgi:hypothetical protein
MGIGRATHVHGWRLPGRTCPWSMPLQILGPTRPIASGFIGRHLALYIHENNLASEVRLVDKVLPQLAWFGRTLSTKRTSEARLFSWMYSARCRPMKPEDGECFEEACSKDKFVQADASREREWRGQFPPSSPKTNSLPRLGCSRGCIVRGVDR